MVNHDTMQIGKQQEYSWRDNNRAPDNIPLDFPACSSRCQSQSVFTDEFPHLDIIDNLLGEEHGTVQTSMSNSGFQSLSNG